jgi:hypothetical protein
MVKVKLFFTWSEFELPAFLFSAGVFVSTSVAEELFSDNPID